MLTLGCGNTRTEYGTFDADGIMNISRAVAFLLRWAGCDDDSTSVGDAGCGLGALLLGMRASGLLPGSTKYIGVELMEKRVNFAKSLVQQLKCEASVAFYRGEYTVELYSNL
jgi:tRNA1(Val) A37 N6-methylase TrmN6